MLTNSYFNPHICERVVRRNGRLFRVRFAVAVIDGEVCGRILSAEPVGELGSKKKEVRSKQEKAFYLPSPKKAGIAIKSRYQSKKIISPFSELQFFVSQMTRAPSCADRTRTDADIPRTDAENKKTLSALSL